MDHPDFDIIAFAEMLGQIDWNQHPGFASRVMGDIRLAYLAKRPRRNIARQGRPPVINNDARQQIRERYNNGEPISEIAHYFCVSRATIYRAIGDARI
jgi:DNA invertase Pin-like site-specific DNA recombinase